MAELVWRKARPAREARSPEEAPPAETAAAHDADAAIVTAAQADPHAFAPLYARYHPAVFGYCYRRSGDMEAAADLTQQIFLRALRSLPDYRPHPGATFRSWLFTIAHNMVIDSRRKTREHRSLDQPGADGRPLVLPDRGMLPEQLALVSERRERVHRAVAQLPERRRQIVELRLAGLTGAEIAATLGMTLSAVKSAQFHAYATLRTLLDDPEDRDAI